MPTAERTTKSGTKSALLSGTFEKEGCCQTFI